MDLTSKPLTQSDRDKLYAQLAEAMMSALENDLATENDAADSAEMILTLDTLSTWEEALTLLASLAARWDFYKSIYLDAKKDELLTKVTNELQEITHQTT